MNGMTQIVFFRDVRVANYFLELLYDYASAVQSPKIEWRESLNGEYIVFIRYEADAATIANIREELDKLKFEGYGGTDFSEK